MTDRQSGEGGRAFFLLAAVILGGLLFALGVMVGRTTAPAEASGDQDALGKIDARDAHPLAVRDDELEYPKALSGPPAGQQVDSGANKAATARPPTDAAAKKPTPTPDVADPPADPGGARFCLQVASFQKQDQAEQLVGQLKQRGLPDVRFVSGEVEGKGTYYRVRVGRFTDREKAEALNDRKSLEGLIILSDE